MLKVFGISKGQKLATVKTKVNDYQFSFQK